MLKVLCYGIPCHVVQEDGSSSYPNVENPSNPLHMNVMNKVLGMYGGEDDQY
jgi:hypothetical protein